MAGKRIRTTYEIWTEEDREIGDTDQRGFVDEEGEDMAVGVYFNDTGNAADNAIDFLRQHGPILEPSESGRGAAPRWYTDTQFREDYKTGEDEERSYHLHGFSEAERRKIGKAIKEKSYKRNPSSKSEIPIANPSDAEWVERLFEMWFAQVGTQKVYVWASSLDSAFEVAVDWIDDNNMCGLFTYIGEAELREAADDLDVKWPGINAFGRPGRRETEIIEHAERDLTVIGHTTLKCETKKGKSAYVASHEWGGREVTGQRYRDVKRRSLSKPLRISYAAYNVFQTYWAGQGDPLYAVLSRRGGSVDWVTVDASPEEIGRLEDTAEEIIDNEESTSGEIRTAEAMQRQLEKLE